MKVCLCRRCGELWRFGHGGLHRAVDVFLIVENHTVIVHVVLVLPSLIECAELALDFEHGRDVHARADKALKPGCHVSKALRVIKSCHSPAAVILPT
jgi:hypothetical protein